MAYEYYQTLNDKVEDLADVLLVGSYYLFFSFLLPFLALFFYGGIDDPINVTKISIFNPAVAMIYGIFFSIKLSNVIFHYFKVPLEIPAILHDPELSPFKYIKPFKNILVMISFTFILSSVLVLTGIAQTSIPDVEQSVLPNGQFIFSIYPASPSETGMLAGYVIPFVWLNFILWWIGIPIGKFFRIQYPDKKKIGFAIFVIVNVIGLWFIGANLYGVPMHTARYGASESSIEVVRNFWGVSGSLIAITGSIIPSQVLHDVNNGILASKKYFSSTVVNTYVGIFMILNVLFFILLFKSELDKNRKKSYEGEETG